MYDYELNKELSDLLFWILSFSALYLFVKIRFDFGGRGYNKNLESILCMHPRQFEYFCADYWKDKGYKTKVTAYTHDGGKDVIATKGGEKYVIECKRYKGCVGREIIQKIHSAAITSKGTGVVMTTGHYSNEAFVYARKAGVMLIGNEELSSFYRKKQREKAKKPSKRTA